MTPVNQENYRRQIHEAAKSQDAARASQDLLAVIAKLLLEIASTP